MAWYKCPKKKGELKTLTLRLDTNNNNPSTWGTYLDDAGGLSVGSAAFDEFFGHYPCVLSNGSEIGKLNPNNYTKFDDGTSAPITTIGNDVMVCFPKRGLRIWKENNYIYVSITKETDANYTYNAFKLKGSTYNKIYVGAYLSTISSDKMYSVSGQSPTNNLNLNAHRVAAIARGNQYYQFQFWNFVYLQAMYLIKYRGMLAANAIGWGYVKTHSARANTGGANARGMDYGDYTGANQMKLFGIEDFWGNLQCYIDNVYSYAYRIKAHDGNTANETELAYIDAFRSSSNSIGGTLKDIIGTTDAGFIYNATTDFDPTHYFGGYYNVQKPPSGYKRFGINSCYYASGEHMVGPFSLMLGIDETASNPGAVNGSRLVYYKN